MEPDKVDVVNSTSKETIPKTGDGWFEATSNFIDENIRVVRVRISTHSCIVFVSVFVSVFVYRNSV